MRWLPYFLLAVVSVALALTLWRTPSWASDAGAPGKVYELRIYKAAAPEKMAALHARFRDNTVALFKKHGIEVVGFWTPREGDEAKDTLVYLLSFPDAQAQQKSWQAFRDDPEWKTVKAESEKDGPLVKEVQSKNLQATDYSPMK
jgi:hypothetical protein